jgi:phage FluMu gp28-like protein
MSTNEKDFESSLTDYSGDKYDTVVLASMWVKALKRKPEYKNEPDAAIVQAALDDIINKKISKESIINGSAQAAINQNREEEAARIAAEKKAKEPMTL